MTSHGVDCLFLIALVAWLLASCPLLVTWAWIGPTRGLRAWVGLGFALMAIDVLVLRPPW